MSKLLILMMDHDYPFNQYTNNTQQIIKIQVQQTFPLLNYSKNMVVAKANFLKNLKNKYLIKVQSLLQEDDTVYVMYQLVQCKLQHILVTADTLMLNKIYAQMHDFGRYLSNIGVRILFSIDRFGFTPKQTIKYFMGLDFSWQQDPDQQYLQQFYSKQIQQILHPYLKYINVPQPPLSTTQISHYQDGKIKNRKVSYTTLPSKGSKLNKIDSKIKKIKSSSPKLGFSHNFKRKQLNKQDDKYNYDTYSKQQSQFSNTIQKRKLSGQAKFQSLSRCRLNQKQSDIKSEYWNTKRKQQKQLNQEDQRQHSQAGTGTSKKSRTQQLRQKQYREMLNMNKTYLKDFMQVLQQVEQHNPNPQQDHQQPLKQYLGINQFKIKKKSLSTSVIVQITTMQLQQMAQKAIEHSASVIQKFKRIFCVQ